MTKWSSTHTDYYNSHNHIAFPLLLHHCFLFVLSLYSPFFLLSAKWYHKNLNYYLEPFLPPSYRLSFISIKFANSVQLKFLSGLDTASFWFLPENPLSSPTSYVFLGKFAALLSSLYFDSFKGGFFSFFNPVLASCNTSSFRWNHLSTLSLPRSH